MNIISALQRARYDAAAKSEAIGLWRFSRAGYARLCAERYTYDVLDTRAKTVFGIPYRIDHELPEGTDFAVGMRPPPPPLPIHIDDRDRALSDIVAMLRFAERQGIKVDWPTAGEAK